MSGSGHELPRHLAERAAVMPPTAAAPSRDQGGRRGQIPAARTCSKRRARCNALLDHLVGATKQRQREGETEPLGGLKIDNELDFCKQLDGQV
jgi:hypothetical protein